MTGINEQELSKKLAKWAGFEETPDDVWAYKDPNGIWCDLPNFTQSLDACFRWFEKPLIDYFIKVTPTEEEYRQALYNFLCKWLNDYIWNEPHRHALALCLAIKKLIGETSNGR